MASPSIPIRRVRTDGAVDLIGHYLPAERLLRLDAPGFPLTSPGEHRIEGDLPWVFQDMAPAGFLARRFAGWFPELGLDADARTWTAADVLTAVSERGHDLPGNLVIGASSWERYQHVFQRTGRAGPPRDQASQHYERLADDVLVSSAGEGSSSVGGERPKFTLRLEDGRGLLVKFTPPLDTALGRRWADLLRIEAHCLATLRAAGIAAAAATFTELGGRGYLEVERFDRLAGGGRLGAFTLYWLAASRQGDVSDLSGVVGPLRSEGWLEEAAADRLHLVHAFSAAIGNTDAHLGNYALTVDDEGRVALAPFYDVLPMALAPRHDELPDAHLRPLTPPAAAAVRGLVEALLGRVSADPLLSPALVARWRGHIGL